MLFQEIEIANLFSYQGRVFFDLTGHQQNRPIVLISGRNGFGKTSFLNAIKLLFCGPSEELRNNVLAGRKLSPKFYMLGHGEEWMGVFNYRHREKRPADFYVRSQWREKDGLVSVRRQWFPDENEFDANGKLTIEAAFLNERLEGDEAKQFLERRLPGSYLPYFFFDGEKIQTIAEANRQELQEQVEGILNIAPINSLLTFLDRAKRQWSQTWAAEAEKLKFNDMQREIGRLQDQLALKQAEKEGNSERLNSLEEQIADRERHRRAMQGFRAQEEEASHKKELEKVQERLAELRQEIVERFIPEAPLAVNLPMAQQLLDRLQEDDQSLWSQQELLGYLRSHLPVQVFDRPAPPQLRLREEQSQYYRSRLHQALAPEHLQEDLQVGGRGLALESARQASLRKMLISVLERPSLSEHARRLDEVSRLARREIELQQKLDEISTVVEKDRDRYRQVQEELRELQKEKDECNQKLGSLETESQKMRKDLEKEQEKSSRQERKMAEATRSMAYRQKADQLTALYKAYKEELKIRRRKELQDTVNTHFKTLMTSHDQVRFILVDEHFGLHYQDAEGRPLGGANLSAGMKQLVAIALLWALKDVSGKEVPVIIDTPLARIDRQNQENLLRDYFPHVAEQVIILPTDSELDREKYHLLKPYVYREYTLANPHGDQTQVAEQAMYKE
ncbi:MAG: DNA sulfur modification protein DndD [Magnetococcales bacterium]|nr:DNA sulfur modification protein DndD [Magnetococcales bacterium]